MTLSFKILRYNYFAKAFYEFVLLPDSIIRYGLTDPEVAVATAFIATWDIDLKPYVAPLGNNTRSIETINTDYQTGFTLSQSFKAKIKNITTITLSADERAILGIKKSDSSHSTAGIPKNSPSITCIGQSNLMMNLVAINPELPFKRAKPKDVDAIGFKIAITDAGAPAPPLDAYVRQENETTTEFEMLFTSGQVGKTLYIIGFYINSKNQAGHDSLPYIITII